MGQLQVHVGLYRWAWRSGAPNFFEKCHCYRALKSIIQNVTETCSSASKNGDLVLAISWRFFLLESVNSILIVLSETVGLDLDRGYLQAGISLCISARSKCRCHHIY